MTNDEAALAPWQRHNARLGSAAVGSIVAAISLWRVALTPDGRDPWYAAIAVESFVWGAIDLAFVVGGWRGVAKIRSLDDSARLDAASAQNEKIDRALRFNVWLNLLWLTVGVALLVWGYGAWSPSLVGHGVGVTVQAIILTVLDTLFANQLRGLESLHAAAHIDELPHLRDAALNRADGDAGHIGRGHAD